MDKDVKLSFIPKKSLIRDNFSQARPTSLFLTLSFSLLVVTMAVYIGLYFYTNAIKNDITSKKTALEETRKKLDLTIIEKANNFKSQVESTQGLIDGHVALSSLFDFLGKITLPSIGYDTFEYNNAGGSIEATLKGKAANYASLALQKDAFSLEVEKKNLSNFTLGNYKLDENGNVGFGWKATLNQSPFLYKNTFGGGFTQTIPAEEVIEKNMSEEEQS